MARFWATLPASTWGASAATITAIAKMAMDGLRHAILMRLAP